MNSATIDELLTLLKREAVVNRGKLLLGFVLISLLMLTAGFFWKKNYESSVTIFIDDSNIVRPLLQGAAETTTITDRAKVAAEIIFGEQTMEKILRDQGWLEPGLSPESIERQKEKIKQQTSFTNIGNSLLMISYKDVEPKRAYGTAKQFAELFLDRSRVDQSRESNEAFAFIDGQTEIYRTKLSESEHKLAAFKNTHQDARPDASGRLDERIVSLRRKIEVSELELSEARSRHRTLSNELEGEARAAASEQQEEKYFSRIAQLREQLNEMLLSYTDTYPDVVALKEQISDLQRLADKERDKRASGISDTFRGTKLYQDLRQKLATAKAEVGLLEVRLSQRKKLLSKELERAKRTSEVETELAELTREYEVNQEIFQDLLKRRESARVSMNLDSQRQGLSFRIQEPATMPILPKGLRFIHFMIIGLFLGIVVPLGFLILYVKFDPRIRLTSTLEDQMDLLVMAVVPQVASPAQRSSFWLKRQVIVMTISVVFLIYFVAGTTKLLGLL